MTYVINPDNKIYQKALKREFEVWSNAAKSQTIELKKPLISEFNPVIIRYNNHKLGIDSDEENAWLDFLVKNYGPLNIGLSLGAGARQIETTLMKKNFIHSFDTIDIVKFTTENELNGKHVIGDLNFIELPKNKYDLILCKGIFHHIINLEHLLFQINKSLKPDGYLVVREYIGENKQQWSDKKMIYVNKELKNEFGDKYPFMNIKRPPINNISPFESIRSSDIPQIISAYFNIKCEVKWGWVSWPILNHLSWVARHEKKELLQDANIVNEIIEFGVQKDKEIDNTNLQPCSLFGVYSKANVCDVIECEPWSLIKIKQELELHATFSRRIKMSMKKILKQ